MGTQITKTKNTTLELDTSPTSAEDASETPHILPLLASVLEKTIHRNDKFLKRSRTKDSVTIFHGSRAPGLSIRQYIDRIFKYSKCSPSCFVVAYVYMDRFIESTGSYLTSLNAHRLLLTCVLLAVKFLEDSTFNNAYYAKVGGVSIDEMNKLELKLLFSLDYRLHVTLETFDHYCLQLEKEGTRTVSRSASFHIERAIQICGFGGSWPNRDEPKCTTKFATYTCRAI